ncbi:hypothetical protein [Nocardia fluminea]|uniref:hypothetical protein n=1 Tax=Nocardia fluminea TaxID=134984 RepID=UPI0033C95465
MSVPPAHSRWQDPFTVFQTNLQEVDATMDVEAALDVIESHGADTWLVNAGGISAFYPTALPYHTLATHFSPIVRQVTSWVTRSRRRSDAVCG